MTRLVATILALTVLHASRAATLSDKPDTPFKLATFEANGAVRIGLVLGDRVFDIALANSYVSHKAHLPAMKLPQEMRELIEQYPSVAPRCIRLLTS
jgi:hypothetical protein